MSKDTTAKPKMSLKAFIEEVKVEIRKSTWPERGELIQSTIVVIVSVALLGAFVGVSDSGLSKIINWLLR